MKQYLSLILFLTIGFVGRTQGYIPFPDSGATWVNTLSVPVGSPVPHCEISGVKNYCINGEDTTINLINYTKINECAVGFSDYKGAVRSSVNGQVYYIPKDSTSEFLLMDFDVSVGDTIDSVYFESFWGIPQLSEIEIVFFDTTTIWGTDRKRITFQNTDYLVSGTWIEGIGNVDGLFLETADVFDACIELKCMTLNDTILWPSEDLGTCQLDLGFDLIDFDFQIFPNPSSDGIFKIQHNSKSDNLTFKIFKPNGQLVQEGKLESNQIDLGFESGIYFIQFSNGQALLTRRIIVQ
jgi:hypothetical protein